MGLRLLVLAVALSAVAIGIAAIAACNDSGGSPSGPTPTAVTATPTQRPQPTPAPTLQGARTPVEGTLGFRSGVPSPGLLTNVNGTSESGFDRIVFTFTGAPPDYRVEYVPQVSPCASGEPAQPVGPALLQVRFTPAQAHDNEGVPSIGRTDLLLNFPSIVNAVETCDFEGEVTWVLGLVQEEDFTATPMQGTLGLAVRVAHPRVTPTPLPGIFPP